MRLIDADKLKQHYAWWNDEIKELFDTIVDLQPTIEPEEAKRGKWLMCMKTGRLECTACGHQTGEILGRQVTDFPEEELKNAEISATQENATYYEVKVPNYCANCGAKL